MRKIFIIIDIILVLLLIGLWISMPEELQLNLIVSGIAVILTGVLIFPEKEVLFDTMRNRFTQNILNSLFTSFLIFSILGILSYLIYKHNKTWDLTSNKVNSLSRQSKLILDSLKGDVRVTLFAKRSSWESYLSLLKIYSRYKSSFYVKAVDLDLNPLKAKKYNITKNGQGILFYEGREVVAQLSNEVSITNAILKLSTNKKKTIYYTTGHSEISFQDNTKDGASFLSKMISNSYYNLKPRDLALTGVIPKEADALLILGPKNGFLDKEVKIISKYLEDGGKLILALDPVLGKKDVFMNLRSMLTKFGLMIRNDVIVDRLSTVQGTDASILLVEKFNKDNPITKNFKSRVIFPLASSILKINNENYKISPLAFSTQFPGSWAESDTYSLLKGRVTYSSEDLKGPVTMAMTSESKTNALDFQTKIFVVGTSRFILNGYQNQTPNFNLFLNAISWVVDDNAIISMSRPELQEEKIYMSDKQIKLIWYLSILLIPLFMGILSIVTYRKRARL